MNADTTPCYLLLGSNLGNRQALLDKACEHLQQRGIEVQQRSSVYETKPWGFSAEQDFLNMVLLVQTTLSPQALLQATQRIEQELGRVRLPQQKGYTSRTIDIDILLIGQQIISTPNLCIPHPRLHLRMFTLMPLNEIAHDFFHPVLKKTVRELLQELQRSEA